MRFIRPDEGRFEHRVGASGTRLPQRGPDQTRGPVSPTGPRGLMGLTIHDSFTLKSNPAVVGQFLEMGEH